MASDHQSAPHYLFGRDKPWRGQDWIDVDDRVRGGKSQSYLECAPGGDPGANRAVFRGLLDITALGGAGFASQRTADPRRWDLSAFQGLRLSIGDGDGKKYTLTLKDEVLPKRPDGREQSSVSWEYDFVGRPSDLVVPWDDFKPTYRGKPKPDAEPLDLSNIRRISIMMRSFFGDQEGPFSLELNHIAAIRPEMPSRASTPESFVKQEALAPMQQKKSRWSDWFCGLFGSRL